MEFSGIGVVHFESPPEQLRPFFKRKFKTFFRAYNKSGSGVITKQDMKNLAHEVSLSIPEKDRQNNYEQQCTIYEKQVLFFKEKITEDEFVKEWTNVCFGDEVRKKTAAEKFREWLKVPFASIDTNDDGIINYEEFRKFYELRKQNPNTAKVVFESIDTNEDGEISFEEWAYAFVSFFFASGPESSFSLFYGPLVED